MKKSDENAEFDAFAPGYNAGMEDPIKRLVGASADVFLDQKASWLADFLNAHATGRSQPWELLDFGCGTGGFLQSLQRMDFQANLQGCDVSLKMLEEARSAWSPALPIPPLHHTQPGVLPFASGSFDVVSACCVFHHIPPENRLETVRELFRVLKPGGWLVILEHNPWNPLTRWIVSQCPIDENAVLLSASECSSLARQAGFTRPLKSFFLFLPPRFPCLWKWERRLFGWLPLGGQYAMVATAGAAEY